MRQDVSDGSSKGGAAPAEMEEFSVGDVGAENLDQAVETAGFSLIFIDFHWFSSRFPSKSYQNGPFSGPPGARKALHAAYLRAGSYFSGVASGAAWLSGAAKPVVTAMRKWLGHWNRRGCSDFLTISCI